MPDCSKEPAWQKCPNSGSGQNWEIANSGLGQNWEIANSVADRIGTRIGTELGYRVSDGGKMSMAGAQGKNSNLPFGGPDKSKGKEKGKYRESKGEVKER